MKEEMMKFYGSMARDDADPLDLIKSMAMPIPGTKKEVLARLALLPYMIVKPGDVLHAEVTYKGETFFELQKNLFYGRLTYAGWPVGGDQYLSIYTVNNGWQSAELEFEKPNSADDTIKFWRSFFKKAEQIRHLARKSITRDLKRLNLVQLRRDIIMYLGAKELCEEVKAWKILSALDQ